MDVPITTFRGLRFTKPKEQLMLADVLNDIKNGKWKDRVLKCHQDLKYKDWLPVFTPTGIFSHRSIKGMDFYNGVVCLDVDHVEDPVSLKAKTETLPWVHAAFITPSGKGLKVIVLTNSDKECYTLTEIKVADMYFEATGFHRDNRCKDIARIQYISYDPELYYNRDSEILEKVLTPIEELCENI
jgi:hypothetical protein